jgi:hypothetical protein
LRDVNHGIYCIYHINSGAGVYKAILTLWRDVICPM